MDRILITDPLLHKHEELYGPFEVEKYINDTSRIITFSDIGLNVDILHSLDGSREKVIHATMRSPLKMFRSEKFEWKTRFFYILITRTGSSGASGDVNKELHVEIITLWKAEEMNKILQTREIQISEKIKEAEEEPAEYKRVRKLSFTEEERDSGTYGYESDCRSALSEIPNDVHYKVNNIKSEIVNNSRRSSIKNKIFGRNAIKHKHNHDDRLPSYIPQHSILVGGLGGSMYCLPKPIEIGSTLQWTECGVSWVSPSEK